MTLKPLPSPDPRNRPVASISHLPTTAPAWWESGLQIGFNAIVAIAALGSLVQLLPERQARRTALNGLESDLAEREVRVDRLRERFTYYFDPAQLESVVREESQKIHPQQRPIVWRKSP
ncbi:MAG: hypothetical protein ACFB9N_17955 [Geitlerinemataceae cyanobacterium]